MGQEQNGSNRSVRTSWHLCSTMHGKQAIWPNRLELRVGNGVHLCNKFRTIVASVCMYVCVCTKIGSTYVCVWRLGLHTYVHVLSWVYIRTYMY